MSPSNVIHHQFLTEEAQDSTRGTPGDERGRRPHPECLHAGRRRRRWRLDRPARRRRRHRVDPVVACRHRGDDAGPGRRLQRHPRERGHAHHHPDRRLRHEGRRRGDRRRAARHALGRHRVRAELDVARALHRHHRPHRRAADGGRHRAVAHRRGHLGGQEVRPAPHHGPLRDDVEQGPVRAGGPRPRGRTDDARGVRGAGARRRRRRRPRARPERSSAATAVAAWSSPGGPRSGPPARMS